MLEVPGNLLRDWGSHRFIKLFLQNLQSKAEANLWSRNPVYIIPLGGAALVAVCRHSEPFAFWHHKALEAQQTVVARGSTWVTAGPASEFLLPKAAVIAELWCLPEKVFGVFTEGKSFAFQNEIVSIIELPKIISLFNWHGAGDHYWAALPHHCHCNAFSCHSRDTSWATPHLHIPTIQQDAHRASPQGRPFFPSLVLTSHPQTGFFLLLSSQLPVCQTVLMLTAKTQKSWESALTWQLWVPFTPLQCNISLWNSAILWAQQGCKGVITFPVTKSVPGGSHGWGRAWSYPINPLGS